MVGKKHLVKDLNESRIESGAYQGIHSLDAVFPGERMPTGDPGHECVAHYDNDKKDRRFVRRDAFLIKREDLVVEEKMGIFDDEVVCKQKKGKRHHAQFNKLIAAMGSGYHGPYNGED